MSGERADGGADGGMGVAPPSSDAAGWEGLLARPGLDFGIPTDRGDAMMAFYAERTPCSFLSRDPIVEGQDEVFYELHRSWLKLNTTTWALPPAVSGFRELIAADPTLDAPRHLVDPDGLPVTLVPPGTDGIDEVGVVIRSEEPDRLRSFLAEGFGAEARGEGQVVGNTLFRVEPCEPLGARTPILTRGFTMLTLIVHDLLAVHDRLIAAGGSHGLKPALDPAQPERCIYSFVSDPDGNWIELVQFGELSGPLPALAGPALTFDEFFAFRDHGVPA